MTHYVIIRCDDLEQALFYESELATGNCQYSIDGVVVEVVDKELDQQLTNALNAQTLERLGEIT